jgi:predicted lipoprotein with Yx(FWY)xxD motif
MRLQIKKIRDDLMLGLSKIIIAVLAIYLLTITAFAERGPTYTVNISSKEDLGEYLVDGTGSSLYYSQLGKSDCTGLCTETWPPFYAAEITVPAELNKSDFKAIKRGDGREQTAYKGWPLYYFSGDKGPGNTSGDGELGGAWVLARPFGTVLIANNSLVGRYLTDARGITLYHIQSDGGRNVSICTSDECTEFWPAFFAGVIDVSGCLKADDFGTIITPSFRGDTYMGSQTSYKGWPLYYYSGDSKPGDLYGQGLFGSWSVVDPADPNKFP